MDQRLAGLLERLLRQADEQSRDFHRSLPLFLGALHLALCLSAEEGELHALHNSLTTLLHHACGAEAVSSAVKTSLAKGQNGAFGAIPWYGTITI